MQKWKDGHFLDLLCILHRNYRIEKKHQRKHEWTWVPLLSYPPSPRLISQNTLLSQDIAYGSAWEASFWYTALVLILLLLSDSTGFYGATSTSRHLGSISLYLSISISQVSTREVRDSLPIEALQLWTRHLWSRKIGFWSISFFFLPQ